jgi:hypothetical protein
MVAVKSYQADAFLKAVERVPPAVLFYGTDAGLVGERAATLAKRLRSLSGRAPCGCVADCFVISKRKRGRFRSG